MAAEKSPHKATLTIPEAARQLGIGIGLAYQLARSGQFPAPVIFLGARRMVVSKAALEALLSQPAREPQ